jgi:PhnB protein
MAGKVKSIPDGCRSITPHLVVKNGVEAIGFYVKAFGARELMHMPGPDGKGLMHAEMQIGDSRIYLCDEFPGMNKSPQTLGGSPVTISLYVENADATYNQAVSAGATATMPLTNMFWGDRFGKLKDPFGHEWSICQHIEDVSNEEMAKRAADFNKQFAAQMGKK